MRWHRIWIVFLLLPILGMAWQIPRGAGPWPSWADTWHISAPAFRMENAADGMSLDDLRTVEFPLLAGETAKHPEPSWRQQLPEANSGMFDEIFLGVRETEARQRQKAVEDWAAYLDDLVAQRLEAARLRWEENLRDVAIEFGEENDRALTAYAARVRRENFQTISSLEMRITLSAQPEERQHLEARLKEVLASVEQKIAARREELARQCALEISSMRQQAVESLAALARGLKEEARASLQAFKEDQDSTYARWLARQIAVEQASRRSWFGKGTD